MVNWSCSYLQQSKFGFHACLGTLFVCSFDELDTIFHLAITVVMIAGSGNMFYI